MKKGTFNLALGLAAAFLTVTLVAQQMGFIAMPWEAPQQEEAAAQAAETMMAVPVNDACADAIPLTVNVAGCSNNPVPPATAAPTAGNSVDGSNDSARPLASCHFPGGVGVAQALDVWYSFAGTAGVPYTITVNGAANFDAVVSVYNNCASATNIAGACADAFIADGTETLVFTPAATGTFFIRVYDWETIAPIGGDFTIQISRPPSAPTNDLCANATVVPVANGGTGVASGNIGANDDGPLPSCLTNNGNVNSVFFNTTVTQTGNGENNVLLTTINPGAGTVSPDTYISGVFTTGCAAVNTCVGSNDDLCFFQSGVFVTATATTTYTALVNGFGLGENCFNYKAFQLPSITAMAAGGAGAGCDIPTNTSQWNLIVTHTGALAGSTLNISIPGVGVQTFATTASPQQVVVNVPANFSPQDVTAFFTGGTVPAHFGCLTAATVNANSSVTFNDLFISSLPCQQCSIVCNDVHVQLQNGECEAESVDYNVDLSGYCITGGPASLASVAGFQCQFAPANWTFVASTGGTPGTVNTAGAPGSITMTSENGSIGPIIPSTYRITVPTYLDQNCNGTQDASEPTITSPMTISFNWTWASPSDVGAGYDPFGYTLTGAPPATIAYSTANPGPATAAYTQLTQNGSFATFPALRNQAGTATIAVNPGSTFGLVLYGDFFGGSTAVISNFTLSAQLPANAVTPTVVFTDANTGDPLPPGGNFPVGTTTVEACVSINGVTNCCEFDVIVSPLANPTSSPVCNDLVNVPLDENCSYCLAPDDVLEGNSYGCFDQYVVQVDKTLPYGNGPWVDACFGAADVNKTYQYRVFIDLDGDGVRDLNENACWGDVKIEDKLAPQLICEPFSVACNSSVVPGTLGVVLGFEESYSGAPVDITTASASTVVASLNVSGYSAQSQIAGLTVTTEITHTWVGDLRIELQNVTTGQTVTLVDFTDNAFACTQDNLLITFDDGGAPHNTLDSDPPACVASFTGLDVPGPPYAVSGTWAPAQALSAFSGASPNGQWDLIVTDAFAADGGQIEGFTLSFGLTNSVIPGIDVDEGCCLQSLTYIDTEVDGSCAAGTDKVITRKWTATDCSGNVSTCNQIITVVLPTLADLVLPPDYDDIDAPAFDCEDGAYPFPQWIEQQPDLTTPDPTDHLQGWPYVFGLPEGCTIGWTYDDILLDVCDGTYKIRRVWTIIDWCLGDGFEYNQIIKVLDDEQPVIDCPADMVVSTNPITCCATVNLPDVIVDDNCSHIVSFTGMITTFDLYNPAEQTGMYPLVGSGATFGGNNFWDYDTLAVYGNTPCLPLGSHIVTYMVEDDCGNTATCTFRLTVEDHTPPFPACQQFTTVSIGVDDPNDCYEPVDGCTDAGITWVPATSFDSGSYDNCGNVHLTVYRMAPYSDCIEGLNHVNGHPDCSDPFQDVPSEYDIALGYERNLPYFFVPDIKNDSIKFYCCEVGTTQTVVLRVYQTDVEGNIQFGPNGPIFNECMVQVEVQDKVKPACVAPANVTVWCENFDPSLWAYGNAQPYDNCCLDTAAIHTYQNQCGLTHSANYTRFDTLCNRGTITRTWRAWDCHGESGTTCTQQIFVNYRQDYFVKFPADVIVTTCDGTGNYGEPTFLNEDCELMAVSMEEDIFTVVPDACFKIERTWTVTNWCTYNGNLNPLCVDVPNPNPNPISNHVDNLPGVTISANGTLSPWNPTVRDVFPNQGGTTAPTTNYSVFYHGGVVEYAPGQTAVVPPIGQVNCFRYKQIIKVIDTQAPEVVGGCPASPVEFCDLTPNNVYLWNEMYWWDNVTMQHDLCEGPTDLCITATDACSGANINIDYLLFLDLDGDGVMETVLNSINTGIGVGKYGYDNVPYGNYLDPNFGLGTPREFDNRLNASGTAQLPLNQRYGFTIQRTVSGNNLTACVRWNTIAAQTTYVVPELPYGTHKIKWIISDGCGNQRVCEYTFIVRDCKPPTVVCYNGLSVNIMPTGMITLWATDFLQYAEDNCTPTAKLKYGIVKSAESTGTFPSATSVTFTCDELGTQPVQLWAQDLGNPANAAYCETYLIVQDPFNNCGGNPVSVAGALKTEETDGVEGASVELAGTPPNGLPDISVVFPQTDDQGSYLFNNALPLSTDYTVTPTKDDNPMNGVSTFDLVLMSKHILGITPLNSPYKVIAADVNKSNSVTTFDIVELRKLILGIYTELPNNTSWRFLDKGFVFGDPANPFASVPFSENISLGDVQNSQMDDDFVGVKIGDLNGDVTANATQSAQNRTAGTLLLDVEDRAVAAGETFDVTFKAAEAVQGLQFTLNLAGVSVADIAEQGKVSAANFGVFEDALTASIDGAQEFTVRFRADKAGQLSEMLQLSSRITKSEAYNNGNQQLDVALRFSGNTIAGVGFELYQNQPNPWVGKTMVGFHLPAAATATLTVYDETGRVLFTQKGDYAKGYNAVQLDRAVLNTVGVLYYKLETSTDSATKKMIQTK